MANLANLKSEVDKLDIDKLKPNLTNLSKLSNVVKNDVVKKTDNNKSVTKVNHIDTSGLVKKTDCNTKITEIEDKIPDTSNFATKTALTTVENKTPDISSLVEKSDYNRKITGIKIKINKLQLRVLLTMFYHDNPKEYLMKLLSLLQYLILVSVQD